jgi:hypothetical protein
MLAHCNRLLSLAAATLALGAVLAPRSAAAMVSRPGFGTRAGVGACQSQAPDLFPPLLNADVSGSGQPCRNDPVNNSDPLGLDPNRYVKLGLTTPEDKARYFQKDGQSFRWHPVGNGISFATRVDEFEGYYGISAYEALAYAQANPGDVPEEDYPITQGSRPYSLETLMGEQSAQAFKHALRGTLLVGSGGVAAHGAIVAAPAAIAAAGGAYDAGCTYAYVKGGYYLGRAAAPVAAAWQWLKQRVGRGQAPIPSAPLPGYGSLTEARIGFIDRATGKMLKQGPLGLEPGQLSSHQEIVEDFLVNPATAQGFSLIPQANGTYLLRPSGKYGGDVSAVLAKIAEFYQIAVEQIVVR